MNYFAKIEFFKIFDSDLTKKKFRMQIFQKENCTTPKDKFSNDFKHQK